jgi:hypothetical protein
MSGRCFHSSDLIYESKSSLHQITYARLLKVPIGRHLLYYLAGFALTTTPGKAGETVRSLYLKSHGVSYTHSLAAFFAERLMDLFAMVGLALLAVSYLEGYRWTVFVAAGLVVAILPFVHSKALVTWLLGWAEKKGRSAKLKTSVEHLVSLL